MKMLERRRIYELKLLKWFRKVFVLWGYRYICWNYIMLGNFKRLSIDKGLAR